MDTIYSFAGACELLARSLRLPDEELVQALFKGEYLETLLELFGDLGMRMTCEEVDKLGLTDVSCGSEDAYLHRLRREHTRLFGGLSTPIAPLYASAWYARRKGQKPIMFVSRQAVEIEKYMNGAGVSVAPGNNEPLDHVSTMLEFMQYVAVRSLSLEDAKTKNVDIAIVDDFAEKYMANWIDDFAETIALSTVECFYKGVAISLKALVGSSSPRLSALAE